MVDISIINDLEAERDALRADNDELKKNIEEHNKKMDKVPSRSRPSTLEDGLIFLAYWFDSIYGDAGTNDEVQQDLRKWAREHTDIRAEVERLRERVKWFEDAGGVAMSTRIFRLLSELETERMRLAACGVVAMANTTESAKNVRIPKDNPYYSASLGDVENAVDREMKLRADLAAAVEVLREILSGYPEDLDKFDDDDKSGGRMIPRDKPLLIAQVRRYAAFLARMEVRP